MHHHGVHAVRHGEGLEVALDGHGQGKLVDQVDRGAGHDGTAAQVLEAEHWRHRFEEHIHFDCAKGSMPMLQQ